MSAQMRLTSDLEMPLPAPREARRGTNLEGKNASNVGLNHHAIEGTNQRGGVVRGLMAGSCLLAVWESAGCCHHVGGEQPEQVAVAADEPVLTAFMAIGAEHGGNLQLDQL